MQYIYLHGFASSPNSAKAQYIRDRFNEKNISITIPDLNQDNFSELTLTRQINQVASEFRPSEPMILIGSSLGGLTAAWLAEKYPQVEKLVLLAPAFGFLSLWLQHLGPEAIQQWQTTDALSVYHYGQKRNLPLNYQFVTDSEQYQDDQLQRSLPTLILHGTQDEVIPIAASRNFAQSRPWIEFIELNSDHALTNVLPEIWLQIQSFCELN